MPNRTAFNPSRWLARSFQRRLAWVLWSLSVVVPLAAVAAAGMALNSRWAVDGLVGSLDRTMNVTVDVRKVRLSRDRPGAVLDGVRIIDAEGHAVATAHRVQASRASGYAGGPRYEIDARGVELNVKADRYIFSNRPYLLVFDKLWAARDTVGRVDLHGAALSLAWDGYPPGRLENLDGHIAFTSPERLEFSLSQADGATSSAGWVTHDGVDYRAEMTVHSPSLAVSQLFASPWSITHRIVRHPLEGTIDIRADRDELRMVVRGDTTVDVDALTPSYIFRHITASTPARIDVMTMVDNQVVHLEGTLGGLKTTVDGTASRQALDDILYVLTGIRPPAASDGTVPFNRIGVRVRYTATTLLLEGTLGTDGLAMANRGKTATDRVLVLPGKPVSIMAVGARLLRLELTRRLDLMRRKSGENDAE